MLGVRPLREFLDQPLFEQPPDTSIQRAWAEPDCSVRALSHILHHRVAVPIPIRQRDQDVKGVLRRGRNDSGKGLSGSRPQAATSKLYLITL